MIRRLCLIAALCFAACAQALPLCKVQLDTVAGPVGRLSFHTAFAARQRSQIEASVLWNYADSANNTQARLLLGKIIHEAKGPYRELKWSVVRQIDGRDSITSTGSIDVPVNSGPKAVLSATLSVVGRAAEITLVSADASHTFAVPYDSIDAVVFGTATCAKTEIVSQALLYGRADAGVLVPASSVDTLSSEKDTPVGPWHYLDRDINTEKASLTHPLDLYVVPDAADNSFLIYTSTRAPSGFLRLKGRLKPTIFTGQYNLEWYDSTGIRRTTDDYAQIMLQGTVLKLNFPLLQSSIRFYRQPPDR